MASIKANPTVMREKSTSLNSISQTIQGITDEMLSEMEGLRSVWEGEAAEETVNHFKQLKDNFQNTYETIKQYATFLDDAAKAQENAENQTKAGASSQPT